MEINRENLLTLIKSGIKRDALSVTGLEKEANVPKDTVRDFLRGKTQILRADKLQKILRVLEPQDTVRISGTTGANGEIIFYEHASRETVGCPPGCDPCDVIAIRVHGDGMLPMFHDGWIVYFSRRHDMAIPVISGGWQVPYEKTVKKPGKDKNDSFADVLGKPCIAGFADGRVFLGVLKRSASPQGGYDLIHYNGTTLRSAMPQWTAKIIFIKTE